MDSLLDDIKNRCKEELQKFGWSVKEDETDVEKCKEETIKVLKFFLENVGGI